MLKAPNGWGLLALFLWLPPGADAQSQEPDNTKIPKARTAAPDSRTQPIRFRPTRAQQNFPRVRAARQRRGEDIRGLFQAARIEYPPAQVLLRVFKKDDVVELWARPQGTEAFVWLKSYSVCMRSGALGPKRRRGDLQVPEGFYHVTRFNPNSNFLLSIQINYPNPSDRIRGHPKDPGGSIFIHGDCVTIGCVPITDRWIEELYLICLDSHWRYGNRPRVHIFPTRLDAKGMAWLEKEFSSNGALLAFWKELQPGYRCFEQARRPPSFTIRKDGSYRFRCPGQPQK